MSLTSKIQALIAYANETTEAGDTTLGDAVKTLCDGYNGGNGSSSPLVLPSGTVSSKIAALLAYANETTGNGDTKLGDAIRTLCEGYSKEEQPEFYDKLIGDGTAYIDYLPVMVKNGRKIILDIVSTGGSNGYDNHLMYAANTFVRYRRYGQVIEAKIGQSASTASVNIGKPSKGTHFTIELEFNNSNYILKGSVDGVFKGEATGSYGSDYATRGLRIYSSNSAGESSRVSCVTVFDDGVILGNLRPCTYKGEAGMWDMVSNTFYGNANTSGAFTVVND